MQVKLPNTIIANFNLSIVICLIIFMSPLTWAYKSVINETRSFDEKLALADEIRSSQPKVFLALISELNQYTNSISDPQRHYLDYLNLYLLVYQGNLVEAITAAKTLINSNVDVLIKFRAKLSLINIFANNQSWDEGLLTLSNMLKELPLIDDIEIKNQGLILAAIFYNQLGQYDLGLSYAKRIVQSSNNGRVLCFAKGEIIKSSFQLKLLSPTDPKIREIISLCRIHKEYLIISLINSNVAKAHLKNQQPDMALKLLASTLQDTLNTKYSRIIAEYYSLMAHSHWLKNNIEFTKNFALQALKQDNKRTTTDAIVLSNKLLFEVAQVEENYQLALQYHQQFTITDKLYYDENHSKHMAFQLAKHQAIEQENRIDLLNKKNALLTAEQALIKANAENTRLIIIVLILTLAVLIFWGIRLLKAHKRIKELAEYDALTGVFNRGHFTQVADSAIEYCKNSEQTLSVIIFDLDYFKKINDSYGHACGDWALKKTVAVCKKTCRQNDILARLGGEEFCILLTSCNSQAAQLRAEAFRKAIADINTTESGFDFTITASFGVTDANTSGFNLESLLADADSAAYAAKHAGRNQVIVFKPETPEEEVAVLDDSRNPF